MNALTALPNDREHPFLQSRMNRYLLILIPFLATIAWNGYQCYRSDHLSQIPLLFLTEDHTGKLFARDWFFSDTFGHLKVRFFHLEMIHWAAKVFTLPLGILLLYALFVCAMIWAWFGISATMYGSVVPAIVVGFLAAFSKRQMIGANALFEEILIPRTEANTLAFISIFLLLKRRPILAGIAMAACGFFQPAVAILFGFPVVLWLLLDKDRREPANLLLFVVVTTVLLTLRLRGLGDVVEAGPLSDAEVIRITAYIRHPHHMIPHTWLEKWAIFFPFMALFCVVWSSARREHPAVASFGRLAFVLIGILAFLTVFIELIPVKQVIIFQPYRMAVLLYFALFMAFAPYLMGLWQRGPLGRARALLVVFSIYVWYLALPAMAVELWLHLQERRGKPVASWLAATVLIIMAACWLQFARELRQAIIVLAVGLGAWEVFQWKRWVTKPVFMRWAVCAACLLGLGTMASQYLLPLRSFVDSGSSRLRQKVAAWCWVYQFNPMPIEAIERVGDWAARNTSPDALFIMPPGRTQGGFHVWSRRAAVFTTKLYPIESKGLAEWQRRFVHLHGILDESSPEGQKLLADMMNSVGTDIKDVYSDLSADQMMALAAKYRAQYVITSAKYKDPRLELCFQDYTRTGPRPRKANQWLYVYKVML